MKNGTEIRRLWMGNGNGNYIRAEYVVRGAEESWIAKFRRNAKNIIVRENGNPCYANDNGKGSINAWTEDGYKTIRVG